MCSKLDAGATLVSQRQLVRESVADLVSSRAGMDLTDSDIEFLGPLFPMEHSLVIADDMTRGGGPTSTGTSTPFLSLESGVARP